MNRFACLLLAAAALAAPAPALAEGATLVRATELKAEPYSDAATVAKLPQQAQVEVLKRQGAWAQVKSKDGQGWLRMLGLKLGSGAAPAKGNGGSGLEAAALSALGVGGPRSAQPTVATGVRGLSEEDLRNARPNPRELERLNQYAVTQGEAKAFAQLGKLRDQKIDYVAAP